MREAARQTVCRTRAMPPRISGGPFPAADDHLSTYRGVGGWRGCELWWCGVVWLWWVVVGQRQNSLTSTDDVVLGITSQL
jgi:hypothetical protein